MGIFGSNEDDTNTTTPAEGTEAAATDATPAEGTETTDATPVEGTESAPEGTSTEGEATMTDDKATEEAALEDATTEAAATDATPAVESEIGEDVYFEGHKVIRFAKDQGVSPVGFVRCEMSDATVMDVPRDLFQTADFSAVDGEDKAE